MSKPKVSVVVPFHWMENWSFFLERCLSSIEFQTYTNYEVVLINHSTMPVTSNRVIQSAKGDIIKVLYMDDYLANEDALQNLVDNFEGGWAVSGCVHDKGFGLYNPHVPKWNDNIRTGANTIGSPSVLAFENKDPLLFDEELSWLLDCDLYHRLYERYGAPTVIGSIDVVIGIHDGQMTNILTDDDKQEEADYLEDKYGN